MSADSIEKLYRNYDILVDAKDNITEHEKEYLEILAAVKGSDKEKRLASQFIAKFFSSFPSLSEQAIEAQFDLCEDDDVAIRKQAIKDLPSLCKDNKDHTHRIADILAQLLQSDDTTELSVVNNSLLAIIKLDPRGTLGGIFSQIHQGTDNEIVRERCVKFLASKVKLLGREVINKEAEEFIISESKKVLEDVTAEEFEHIMELLSWTKLGKTPLGRKELVSLVAAQVLTGDDWQPQESEHVDRLIQCSSHALPYYSAQVDSTPLINFFCEHVLPKLDQVVTSGEEASDPKLELLKLFAELSEYCGKLEKPQEKIEVVYNCLLGYLPEAPTEDTTLESNTESDSQPGASPIPSLQFSHVECALFALHSLGRRAPDALVADPTKLKTLRLRLQYTARLTQGYIKKLKEVTQGNKTDDLKSEENKIKLVALKTTSNINTIIKDLFRSPPSFKSKVQLSFQTKHVEKSDKEIKSTRESSDEQKSTSNKRHIPITFDKNDDDKASPEKRSRNERPSNMKMYTPPSGKYSNKVTGGGRYSGGGYGFRGGANSGRRDFRNGSRNSGGPFRRRNY